MAYNKISLYGEQYIDYMQILQGNNFDRTIINNFFQNNDYKPSWEPGTIMVFNYENSLNSSNIDSFESPFSGWELYRRDINSSEFEFVAKLEPSQTTVIDYMVRNNSTYYYVLFPLTEVETALSISSNTITTDWWNWSLTSLTEDDDGVYRPLQVWLFDCNLNSSTITQNLDKTVYKTFNKYPKLYSGQSNYKTGSVDVLLGKIQNSKYFDSIRMLDEWNEFVNNGLPKILKDRKGDIYLCDTIDSSYSYVDETNEQCITISFNFTQIGDTNNKQSFLTETEFQERRIKNG